MVNQRSMQTAEGEGSSVRSLGVGVWLQWICGLKHSCMDPYSHTMITLVLKNIEYYKYLNFERVSKARNEMKCETFGE